MSQATLSERPYVNSNLFSSHYLDERIGEREEWDCDEEAREAMEELLSLYELEGSLVSGYGEDALIDNWIGEVLNTLGFGSQEEVTLPGGGGYVDELLFETPTSRREAASVYLDTENTTDLFERGLGLLEAKQWDADFTQRFSEQRPYRNASHQIKHYLENTPDNLQWGVLTNGRKWRLYGTKDYETQTYYEVDLPELLERGDLETFKYFYVFFSPAAFRESAGTTFLDEVWSESETASQELGEDLQDNVFTALRVLGRGFIETNGLNIDPDDEESLDELKDQSLVLLYRLMFVLYAEARGLIHPESQSAQDEYEENFSLDSLRLQVHETIGEVDDGFAEEFSEYSTGMWSRLEDLFRLIDEGEESLGIPPYNGGLFDHDEHEFLTEHEVSNRFLAEVVYRLSTTQNDQERYVLADYADLDTRHLGSVYEGLLEHQFRIAPEQFAAVSEDSGQVWKPATEVSVVDAVETVPEGGLYVVNDQGERKATGAYYTPDYVVTYIVEETVGPLVDEIREDLVEQGFEPGTEEYLGPFSQRVIDLKILDPAMGSGHFLTKATGFLAERVMEEVREVETELGVAFNEQHVRREIAKECIYGVDLNGMAVELAKLSMWLETLATDRPLAFLDHHFKKGNSLIGSDLESIEELESDANGDEGQHSLADFGATREGTIERLMDIYGDLLAIDNESVDDVREMKRKYAEIEEDELRSCLIKMTNVHTVDQFDVDIPGGVYEQMAEAMGDSEEWTSIEEENWFKRAQQIAEEQNVFHWKLSFPEVFYDIDGSAKSNAGFDAVVGNPPYVSSRNEEFYDRWRTYIDNEFELALYQVDTYNLFVETAHRLTKKSGYWSFIIPDSWMGDVTGEEIRKWLTREVAPIKFGMPLEPVFQADVDCVVVVAINQQEQMSTEIWNIGPQASSLKHVITLNADGEPLVVSDAGKIINRVENKSVSLDDIALTGRGIGPYHHSVHSEETIEERAYHADKKVDETYRPELAGKNIDRYSINWEGDRWISYGDWLAEPRDAKLFQGPRLLCRKILSKRLCCTYVEEDWLVDQQVYVASQFKKGYNPKYATAILASSLIGFYTRTKYHEDTELFPHIRVAQFRNLPIKQIDTEAGIDRSVPDFVSYFEDYIEGSCEISDVIEVIQADIAAGSNYIQDVLGFLVEYIIEQKTERRNLNLDLLDYIQPYKEGPTLMDFGQYQPPAGVSNTPLVATSEDYEKVRVGKVVCECDGSEVLIHATARYKPEDEGKYETDQWGYFETEPIPAIRLTDLSKEESKLVKAFVPVAVEKAGGFAGFRETATKTKSLIDRLAELKLPDIDNVSEDIDRYMRVSNQAQKFDNNIEMTDELIDKIVYKLYGLNDEEVGLIEEAVPDEDV